MIALWLIAAHLVGDYLLQTRWQAVGKFGWTREAMIYRTAHVLTYLLPFIPIAFIYGDFLGAVGFIVWLGVLHWFTDAQRFVRTPGEVFVWGFIWRDRSFWAEDPGKPSLEPNPWPSLPLAIDQTLHVATLAALGAWFL